MSNTIIKLNDTNFWNWMDLNNQNKSNNNSIWSNFTTLKEDLADYTNYNYLINTFGIKDVLINTDVIENLKKCMPKQYFSEIQYCLSIYSSLFIKIFPVLAKRVEQLAYIEWLLYTEPGYHKYRDHLIHMFKVAFTCNNLLSNEKLLNMIIKNQFNSYHFQNWCEDNKINYSEEENTKTSIIKNALFLASLFHDFGYGYFFLRKYKDRLSKLYNWLLPEIDGIDCNFDNFDIIYNSLPSYFIKHHHSFLTLEEKLLNSKNEKNVIAGFYRDCLPLNHSVASTFFILNIAELLYKNSVISDNLYISFQIAAEAAMLHDMTNENNFINLKLNNISNDKLHFLSLENNNKYPVAILLILADEISLWNRPRIKFEQNKNNIKIELVSNCKEEIEISINEQININLHNFCDTNESEIINKLKKLPCFKVIDNEKSNINLKIF